MKIRFTYPFRSLYALACLVGVLGVALALPRAVAQGLANPIGEVVFTIGQATGQAGASSDSQALQKGSPVLVGQTLRTGSNGHIHVRFIDQGFLSVRPDSELVIEDFAFDSKNPESSRVKFSLKQGTGRVISGKASQAAKENFRLNTPVSAIGIRGTDFVVQTSFDITRVSVYSGAVVVAPFSNGCSASGYGPCVGKLSAELTGSLSGGYLELRGVERPRLIEPKGGSAGKIFAPPSPSEPSAAPPHQQGLTSKGAFSWGRWSGPGSAPPGYELVGREADFSLFRVLEPGVLPSAGVVDFQLASSSVYDFARQGAPTPSVSNARLKVDFGARSYSTSFDLTGPGLRETFLGEGRLLQNGLFSPNELNSNFVLHGSVANSGEQAAYLFFQNPRRGNLSGVLNWSAK